ncbi:hypothetical protein CF074_05425 [Clostridium botulinum]|uniref:hypothetical protein n=1 Tax=Clostridium botulinum TaxID=1491 RepID=UPI001969C7D6|nr:hypothetical protein [Clostridium botulinum]MBN3397137.1 hypothetical protein [Clostridium botulinum]
MERSSFFNAVLDQQGNPDRSYLAEDFARYFSTFIGNGVFPNPANQLQVVAIDNNMQVRIKKGYAWINGYMYENTDDYILKLDPADGVLNRIDRIVLRLDFLERKIKAIVKKGQYASSPVAPVLQRDADAYEIAIVDVYVRNVVIKINQSDITDTRLNNQLCGIVHGTIKQVDTTEIFRQFQAWFNEQKNVHEGDFEKWVNEFKIATGKKFTDWVDDLKNSLDPNEDIAAKLQMQISENKLQLADITTLTGNKDNLKTINKTNLVSAINEVFTSGNNVKFNTVDALLQLDKSLQITKESKWEDIIKNISKVSTGKKWAKGKIDFQNEKLIYELKDLKFIPQNIFIFINMYGDNGRSDYDSWFASTEEFKFNLSQYARNNISNLNQYLINVKIENNGLIITIPNEFYSTPKGICIGGIYFFITE